MSDVDYLNKNKIQQSRELHGIILIGYTISTLGIYLPSILISVYVFQFYVYTINLDPLLTSVGITGRAIITGITSILIGVILDKKRPSKFGKRRPKANW